MTFFENIFLRLEKAVFITIKLEFTAQNSINHSNYHQVIFTMTHLKLELQKLWLLLKTTAIETFLIYFKQNVT